MPFPVNWNEKTSVCSHVEFKFKKNEPTFTVGQIP